MNDRAGKFVCHLHAVSTILGYITDLLILMGLRRKWALTLMGLNTCLLKELLSWKYN
jgi:hypothetical protein